MSLKLIFSLPIMFCSCLAGPMVSDAIVIFDYVKQHDDELSLHTGDILFNVHQVSILVLYLIDTSLRLCHFCLDRGGLVCGYTQWSFW